MMAGIPLLKAIQAIVSTKWQKILQDDLDPNANALSKYNKLLYTIPCNSWSKGWTGKILYASLISILVSKAPLLINLIH